MWGALILATAGMAIATIVGGPGGQAWTFLLVVLVSALINLSRAASAKAIFIVRSAMRARSRLSGRPRAADQLGSGRVRFVAVMLSAGAALLAGYFAEAPSPQAGNGVIIKSALVTYQMHYFSYSTVVIVMLLQHYAAGLAMLVFVLGWASYIAAPHLIGNRIDPGNAALWGRSAPADRAGDDIVDGRGGAAVVAALDRDRLPGWHRG